MVEDQIQSQEVESQKQTRSVTQESTQTEFTTCRNTRGQELWDGDKGYGTGARVMGRGQEKWDGNKGYGTGTRIMGRKQGLWDGDKSYGTRVMGRKQGKQGNVYVYLNLLLILLCITLLLYYTCVLVIINM